MAITSGNVDLGAIIRFIDYLRSPSQGDVLSQVLEGGATPGAGPNPFQAALATPGEVAQGAQPGPTREAAAIGAAASQPEPASTGSRQLLQRLLDNPRLLSDLSPENFTKLMNVNTGLQALEPEPEKPTDAFQKISELTRLNVDVTPEVISRVYGIDPKTTNDLIELSKINAERVQKNQPELGAEEGLTFLANLRKAAGIDIDVTPQIEIPGLGKAFELLTKQEGVDRRTQLSLLEPVMEQLDAAVQTLEVPSAAQWLATPIGRRVLTGLATAQELANVQIPGLPNATQVGTDIATIKGSVQLAASQLAEMFRGQRGGEAMFKRFTAIAQTDDWLASPPQALAAIKQVQSVFRSIQEQTARELDIGGVLENPPSEGLPDTRAAFNAEVNNKAATLLKANPKRYPAGAKDERLHLDAIDAVVKENKVQIPVDLGVSLPSLPGLGEQ